MSPSPDFVKRGRDPSLTSPPRFERTKKQPGSFELVNGKLIEVK